MLTALVIDKDKAFTDAVAGYAIQHNCKVYATENFSYALELLKLKDINVVYLDRTTADTNISSAIKSIRNINSSATIIVFDNQPDAKTAAEAIKEGATNYFVKPIKLNKLIEICNEVEESLKSASPNSNEKTIKSHIRGFDEIETKSPIFYQVIQKARIYASTDSPILITGPTGCGKGLLAAAIHKESPRRNNPFIDVNCSAIPESIFDSECFGHEAGAFTDATTLKKGLFEIADKGTIFLDEIGNISPNVQAKLLKVLEEKSFYRLGGNNEIKVDVRIIASTNRDLLSMVSAGEFRKDLYYRLAVATIDVPPLKDRKEDIIPLTLDFIRRFSEKHNIPIKTLSPDAERALLNYEWHGNVRELKNVIERVMITSRGNTIELTDLPYEISGIKKLYSFEEIRKFKLIPLEDIERDHIIKVLKSVGGNRDKAAKILRISRSTLFQKIKKYKISV